MPVVSVQKFEETGNDGDIWYRDTSHVDGGYWGPPPGGGQAFPIGAIFLSVVATNPNALLGYGTWANIGAGRVLIGQDVGDTDFDTLEEVGGSKTSPHGHGYGSLATSAHSGTAVDAHSGTAVGAHSSHSHAAGTLTPSAHNTHNHQMVVTARHAHSIAAGQGSHQHGMAEGQTDGAGTYMDRSNAASATTALTDLATLPAMVTDYQGSDPAYTENTVVDAHTMSGSTGNESASLTHSVTQPNNHVVTQPNDHTISGSTGSNSPSIVQPYLVVNMWKRTA